MLKVVTAGMAKLQLTCDPSLLGNIMCCLILEWPWKSAAGQLPDWRKFQMIEKVSVKNVNPSPGSVCDAVVWAAAGLGWASRGSGESQTAVWVWVKPVIWESGNEDLGVSSSMWPRTRWRSGSQDIRWVREEQLGLGVRNGRIRDSEVQITCRSGIA